MAKKAFYFSHDFHSRNDPKMVKLLMISGAAGMGVYWAIIEMLYEEGGKLMRSDCDRIAFEMRVDCDLVNKIINSDLFVKDDTFFWSESGLRRIKETEEKSAKARESAHKKWGDANAKRTQSDGNAIKEKKVKEIKGKEINTLEKGAQGGGAGGGVGDVVPGPAQDLDQKTIDLKTEYKKTAKDKVSVIAFVEAHKPDFFEPYFDLWNFFAGERKLPKAAERTRARERQFAVRIKEKKFDFIRILSVAKSSEFILKGNWFTLDFILKSEANYLKVLEGNYIQKTEKKLNGHQQQPERPTVEGQKLARAIAEISQSTGSSGS